MGTELQAGNECPQCGGTDLYDGQQDRGLAGFMRIKKICNECGYEWDWYGEINSLCGLIVKLNKVIDYIGLQRSFSLDEEPEDTYIDYLFEVRSFLQKVINTGG